MRYCVTGMAVQNRPEYSIFFPEKQIEDSEMESLVRMLYNCDERSMQIIKATVRAALDSQPKE